ncbi:VOC family protein [Pseudomonas sp. R2.Fl]|nr:VOC family protein [Pseudomonas sp. R2.Fl]
MHSKTYTIFYVADVERSVSFYARLLDIKPNDVFPSFADFRLDNGMFLGLWSTNVVAPAPTLAGGTELALVLATPADVDAAHERWKALGAEIVQEPVDMVFGRCFCAIDPDGHRIRVMSETVAVAA